MKAALPSDLQGDVGVGELHRPIVGETAVSCAKHLVALPELETLGNPPRRGHRLDVPGLHPWNEAVSSGGACRSRAHRQRHPLLFCSHGRSSWSRLMLPVR